MRYIDEKDVYKLVEPNGVARVHCSQIDELPRADAVEVRHGEWGFDGTGWTCSECGEYALSNKAKMQVHSVYCPNCGAKMDGGKK